MSDNNNDAKRRLTKEDRDGIREEIARLEFIDDSDYMEKSLDDLDAADDEAEALRTRLHAAGEEIAMLRSMLRRLVWCHLDGDELPWNDLREMQIIDEDGFPIEVEEGEEDDEKPQVARKPKNNGGDAS